MQCMLGRGHFDTEPNSSKIIRHVTRICAMEAQPTSAEFHLPPPLLHPSKTFMGKGVGDT